MAYTCLIIAVIFEVLGTIAMKYSEGFTKVIPIGLTVLCHGICFVALAVALKSLPISNVYAILAGVGTAVIALVGFALFNEPLQWQKVLATGMIVVGVVILNFADGTETSNEAALAKTHNENMQNLIEDLDLMDNRIELLPRTVETKARETEIVIAQQVRNSG